MKRRGSYGQQRLQRLAIGVGLIIFFSINIFIYSETHRVAEKARRSRGGREEQAVNGSSSANSQEEVSASGVGANERRGSALGLEFASRHPSEASSSSRDAVLGAGPTPGSRSGSGPTTGTRAFVHNKTVWPYADMDDMVRSLVDRKFWGPDVPVLPSGHYDFKRGVYDKPAVAEAYEVQERVFELTGCNNINVPFLIGEDQRCIEYLTNMANWKELKPLPMEFDQRTIKFEAVFHALRLQDGQHRSGGHLVKSIMKVPQRLFPNEAFSEVASFHADRVMQINRIPPTGWVCIPEDMIRSSVAQYAATTETVDEFLQESGAANYSDWIEKDLFKYAKDAKLFAHTNGGEGHCVYASIQLKVADVFHLLDSALKIPYKAHNDSWHRYFNLGDGKEPIFYTEYFAPSILHISELSTFDYAIGNGDRSPNKNNFVAGGCTRKSECADRGRGKYVFHPNHPTYVHLDQGMGFYGSPKRNPIKDGIHAMAASKPPTFCFFRAPLLSRLDELVVEAEGDDGKKKSLFERSMWEVLPKGIRHFVTEKKLKTSADNMRAVLALARRCLQEPYAPFVLGP
jgi:hypothetical protein